MRKWRPAPQKKTNLSTSVPVAVSTVVMYVNVVPISVPSGNGENGGAEGALSSEKDVRKTLIIMAC